MNDPFVNDEHYVILNGVPIAYVGDRELIWLHPENWYSATRSMTLSEIGALFQLVFSVGEDEGEPS